MFECTVEKWNNLLFLSPKFPSSQSQSICGSSFSFFFFFIFLSALTTFLVFKCLSPIVLFDVSLFKVKDEVSTMGNMNPSFLSLELMNTLTSAAGIISSFCQGSTSPPSSFFGLGQKPDSDCGSVSSPDPCSLSDPCSHPDSCSDPGSRIFARSFFNFQTFSLPSLEKRRFRT